MHIFNDMSSEYSFGGHYLNSIEEFASDNDDDKDVLMSWGINAMYRADIPSGYKRYILIEGEEPTGLQTGKLPHLHHEADKSKEPFKLDKWDVILQASSPSIAEYFNGVYKTKKFVPILYPVHPKWHNPTAEKKYTVAYCGGTHECTHNRGAGDQWRLRRFVHAVRKFPDSVHISAWPSIDEATLTHSCVSDAEKMQIMNETKISVIKNSHFGGYSESVKKLPNWDKYKWTSHIDENWAPSLKGRVPESCICKNLMLVHRDPWNEIEHFLTPDKHFIYFNDEIDLENKIRDCLNNWDSVQHIPENAYKEYMKNWCTNAFYDRFIRQHEKHHEA